MFRKTLTMRLLGLLATLGAVDPRWRSDARQSDAGVLRANR
jgi:hypothetical protein